jgi:YggT family protein
MFVAANLLWSVAVVLHWILQAYIWVIIIRALLSWVNPDPWNPIVQILNRLTDPLLDPIRRRLVQFKGYGGIGIDLSPLLLIAVVYLLDLFIVTTLQDLSMRLR